MIEAQAINFSAAPTMNEGQPDAELAETVGMYACCSSQNAKKQVQHVPSICVSC